MGKQSKLEQKAIEKRTELNLKNNYSSDEGKQYTPDCDAAKHHDDDLHPWGKNIEEGITELYFNTDSNAGGSYDINGGPQGMGGRKFLQSKNQYGPSNQYGEDSVDSSINIDQYNQFIVK